MEKSVKLVMSLVLLGFSLFINAGLFVPRVNAWTPLEGHITSDTTLLFANSPYRVINDVIVDAGAKLTVEPGVKVEFADGFLLIVEGSLYAVGTSDKLITFTSTRPDPSPGVWSGISFNGGQTESLTMKYSAVSYAEKGITIQNKGNVMIKKNSISNNRYGVFITGLEVSSISITENNILSNSEDGVQLYSLHDNPWRGDPDIRNVTVSENTIAANGQDGIKLNVYVYSEPGYGGEMYAYIHNITILGNNIFDNKENGIELYAHVVYEGATPFAKIYDVAILENVISDSDNGVEAYAEADPYEPSTASVSALVSKNKISQCVKGVDIFSKRGKYGLGGEVFVTASNNSISYNNYGLLYFATIGNVAKYNDIYRNTYGMNVTNGATVNAEYNYWGDATGPYHSSLNPEGKGNPVNGNGVDLDFIPFLSVPNGKINERPVARLSADKTTISVGQTVTFDASASTDDGRVDKYFFDFGDGKNSSWTTLSIMKHDYTSVGTYVASLTVMDDFGVKSSNTATKTITVAQQLPTLTVSLTLNPTTANSGTMVSVQVHVTSGTSTVKDTTIQLVSDKGGTFIPQSGYTNSNGDFTSTFTTPSVSEQTNARITVAASKSGYNDGSDYEYVTVLPLGVTPPADKQPPDLTLWAYLAILIVILLTIGGGIALARRKSYKPKQEPAPPSQL